MQTADTIKKKFSDGNLMRNEICVNKKKVKEIPIELTFKLCP